MNMSYCRFHNTRIEVNECLSALEDWDKTLSIEEIEQGKRMFKMFLDYCVEQNIIEAYDSEMVDEVFDDKAEKTEEE